GERELLGAVVPIVRLARVEHDLDLLAKKEKLRRGWIGSNHGGRRQILCARDDLVELSRDIADVDLAVRVRSKRGDAAELRRRNAQVELGRAIEEARRLAVDDAQAIDPLRAEVGEEVRAAQIG